MKRCTFSAFFFLLLVSCTQEPQVKHTAQQVGREKSETACCMVRDSIDFGFGITDYVQDKICLDSMMTIERFEDPDIRFQKPEITDDKRLQWNGCTIDLNDRVTVRAGNAVEHFMEGQSWRFEGCYEIALGDQVYFAAFLFPVGVCSHFIEYPIVLIDRRTKQARLLKVMNLTANPKCFCDIDQDGKLDFLYLNYNENKADFYDVDSWTLKPGASVEMHHLMDMVYVIDQQ